MELSDDEIKEYEEELDELDVKALMVAQTAELREIRTQLQLLTHALSESSEPSETVLFECVHCGAEVPEDERRSHAEQKHNAPSDIGLSSLFEEV